jgi:hypothetical protein
MLSSDLGQPISYIKVLRGFPHYLQDMPGSAPTENDRVIQSPLNFIINLSSYHQTL